MNAIPLTDALRPLVPTNGDVTELQDADGKTVAVVLSEEGYRRIMYDMAHAVFSTPEAEAEAQIALEQARRGECVTTAQLFEELRQRGYMPREAQ